MINENGAVGGMIIIRILGENLRQCQTVRHKFHMN
jgi:hypothetical protein